MDESIVIYLDNHLLVLNKPAGTLTQGDATGDLDLLTLAKGYIKQKFDKPGNVFLGLVHRLDRPVSGAMVFARTSKAASRLARQFKARSVDKTYLAMVEGTVTDGGELIDYVWKDHRRVRIVPQNHPKGLRAELSYRPLATDRHSTLVEVKLATGRPHQIRVQLANQGHAIIGDFKYGATTELDGRNLALHSFRLSIDHPTKGERMTWRVRPPDSWGKRFARVIDGLAVDSSMP